MKRIILVLLYLMTTFLIGQPYQMEVHKNNGTQQIYVVDSMVKMTYNYLPWNYMKILKKNGQKDSILISEIRKITYGPSTDIEDENQANQINTFELSQNYPNPFNPNTVINYQLPVNGVVSIKVYDVMGREIKELVNGYKPAGSYQVNFDGSNLSSGLYIYKIDAGKYTSARKMQLIK